MSNIYTLDTQRLLIVTTDQRSVFDRLLAEETIPIHSDDTLESLEARIHAVEHRLLVNVLRTLTTKSQ